jgi:hypothetical protein
MKRLILAALAAAALFFTPNANAFGGDEEFVVCPDGHSGIATTVTSCAFAHNVRMAHLNQYGPAVVAYSPVTGMAYDMQCAPGFIAHLATGYTVPSVRCVGGNNAVVIVF